MTRIKHSKSTSGHWFGKSFTLVMYASSPPKKQGIGVGRGLLWLQQDKIWQMGEQFIKTFLSSAVSTSFSWGGSSSLGTYKLFAITGLITVFS